MDASSLRSSILYVIVVAGSEPCVLTCTTRLRESLTSILPSDNILQMFHQIMKVEKEVSSALKKAKWMCFKIRSFKSCLNTCPRSTILSAQEMTQIPYSIICNVIEKPNRGVIQYLRCEKDLLTRTEEVCGKMSLTLDLNIRDLCRNMESYRRCYTSQPSHCPHAAFKIKRKVDDALMEATEHLVKLLTGLIPSECTTWRQQSLKEHEWRTSEEEDEDFYYSKEPPLVEAKESTTQSRVLQRATKTVLQPVHQVETGDKLSSTKVAEVFAGNVTYREPDKLTKLGFFPIFFSALCLSLFRL